MTTPNSTKSLLTTLSLLSGPLALIAILFSLYQQQQERTALAWLLLSDPVGDRGKIWALEHLSADDHDLTRIQMSNTKERNSMTSHLGADLRGADLDGAILIGANFYTSDLTGASLQGANLQAANLTITDLVDADLSDAILVHSIIGGDVEGADFSDADISNTDLSGANNLTKEQIASACYSPRMKKPRLPSGFPLPPEC